MFSEIFSGLVDIFRLDIWTARSLLGDSAPRGSFTIYVPQGEDEPWRLSSSSTGTVIPLEVTFSAVNPLVKTRDHFRNGFS